MASTDLLIWVGSSFYKTIDDYVKEASKMGCCRRVPQVPHDVELGKTRVFLAHENCNMAVVFGYYIINGFIVPAGTKERLEADHPELREKILASEDVINRIDRRGCGDFKVEGTYLIDRDCEKVILEEGLVEGVEGSLKVLSTKVPIFYPQFRGYRYVDGDKILEGKPVEDWAPPEKPKRFGAKPKRDYETFAETLTKILQKGPTPIGELISMSILANKPKSEKPVWVYKFHINKMRRKGVLKVSLDKQRLVELVK